MGGLGPDFNKPAVVRYVQIDGNEPGVGLYDLVVANTTYYAANEKTFTNGVSKGNLQNGVLGQFGQINIQQGVKVGIEMCFQFTGTDTPATLENFFLTFYDVDRGYAESATVAYYENIYMYDFHEVYVNVVPGDLKAAPGAPGVQCKYRDFNQLGNPLFVPGTVIDGAPADKGTNVDWNGDAVEEATCPAEVGGGDASSFYENYPCTELVQTTVNGVFTIAATARGLGCDNPADAKQLNDVQAARSVMFEYKDTSCVEMEFESSGDYKPTSGRNFQFAGAAFQCDSQC
jgi:hypothetical protein